MEPGKVVIQMMTKGKCSMEEEKYVDHIIAGMSDIFKTASEKSGYSEVERFEIKRDRPPVPPDPE